MTITSLNISEGTVRRRWGPRCRPLYFVIVALVLLICVGVTVAYFLGVFKKNEELVPPNPIRPLPPSRSTMHRYQKAAVCSDGPPCAEIGKNILEKNGSAVDATLATMFCNGMVNMHSMGLGGGFLMTIYIKELKTAITLNSREAAPLKATPDMFKSDPVKSYKGGLATGVPGELRGYWEAHKRFGKLPWRDIVQPSVELCEKGYNITIAQNHALDQFGDDPNFKEWFIKDGKFKPAGSLVIPTALCKTLRMVRDNGGNDLYNGTLSKIFLEDLKEAGSIITKEDLEAYTPKWGDPVIVDFKDGNRLFSVPPPGSGALLGFILNILDGYKFNAKSIDGINNTVLTYHRMIEAYKYAYAKRTELGDPDFVNVDKVLSELASKQFAEETRLKIKDNGTNNNPEDYGAIFYNGEDHGTAHTSVIAPNGDAVSVTSTINLYFGCGFTGRKTGITLNSGMDDFSTPGLVNMFGVPGSPKNAIAPGKRSLSSMSPSIITDSNGDVIMVVGASGGTKITTAVSQIIMRKLWFGQNIKEAVDTPRIHHQLYPMEVGYEYGVIQPIITGLEALGHKTLRYTQRGSIVCALYANNGTITGNADYRKLGEVFGLN